MLVYTFLCDSPPPNPVPSTDPLVIEADTLSQVWLPLSLASPPGQAELSCDDYNYCFVTTDLTGSRMDREVGEHVEGCEGGERAAGEVS